jgi:hypothetical protein
MAAKRSRIRYWPLVALWLVLVALALVAGQVIPGTALALFGVSLFFLTRERKLWRFEVGDLRAIGSSVLTGSLVALAIFGLQTYLDKEEQRESEEEQFRLTLAVARDLTGLDPPLPLAGLNLPDKVLDEAQLAGEDLTETNLAGASLKGAHLEGADLEDANLFGADLRGAVLVGANLDGANLASANLRDATIYGPRGVELGLRGTEVDARTCWPADLLTSADPHIVRLRERLQPREVEQTGREIEAASIGHACELNFSDVVEHLQVPAPPTTLEALAAPYDVRPASFLRMLGNGVASQDAAATPLTLNTRLCRGSRRVLTREHGWPDATAVVILRARAEELRDARTMLVDQDGETVGGSEIAPKVLLRPDARLPRPVAGGSEVSLLGAGSASRVGEAPDYAVERQVSAC